MVAHRGADRLVQQYIGRIREWFAELNLVLADERGVPVAVEWLRVIGPARPTLKSRYPLASIESFMGRARPDGISLGPWIRTHQRLGVRVAAAAPASQTMTGTVCEWERWTGLVFPESGEYVVPRGLGLLRIDKDSGQGRPCGARCVDAAHVRTPGILCCGRRRRPGCPFSGRVRCGCRPRHYCAGVTENQDSRAVVALTGVAVHRRSSGQEIVLDGIDWIVRPGEHWALLGANGAGKTTLLRLVGAAMYPTLGSVEVLGDRLGRIDMRELRARVGLVSAAQKVPLDATAHTVVLTGATGTVQPLWREYGTAVRERARILLAELGCKEFADRRFGDCSGGQRARILICRALMADPALLLLDEPFNALDLPSREDLVDALQRLAADQPALATVTVTHYVEELPPSTTHAFLLKEGRKLASGAVDGVLTADNMTLCFGRPVHVARHDGRWYARSGR